MDAEEIVKNLGKDKLLKSDKESWRIYDCEVTYKKRLRGSYEKR